MELKITEKKEQPLLKRTKITGEITFEGKTPSYPEVKKLISSSTKAKEELIIIKHLYTKFGATKADLIAFSYKDAELMKKIERIKEEEKKEETAEKSEEKPAEKKEEPKAEDKKE